MRNNTNKILLRGRLIQERRSKELHRQAGVPKGLCGIPKLEKFQAALPGYLIKVLSIDPPLCIIFSGQIPSDKLIVLIKEDDH